MSDYDIRKTAHLEMALAIVDTLTNLRTAVASTVRMREKMASDPIWFLDFVVDSVRKRHVENLSVNEIISGADSS